MKYLFGEILIKTIQIVCLIIILVWAVFPNFYCGFIEPNSNRCIERGPINGGWTWYSFMW